MQESTGQSRVPMIEKVAYVSDRAELGELIARNVGIKAAVVMEDEQERSGTRALLNFGHTIGHAIEASAGYGNLLHGEAISIGLVAAIFLSKKSAGLDDSDAEKLLALLKLYQLPLSFDRGISEDRILELMKRDKKFDAGKIRFVLARRIGDAFVSEDITWKDIKQAVSIVKG